MKYMYTLTAVGILLCVGIIFWCSGYEHGKAAYESTGSGKSVSVRALDKNDLYDTLVQKEVGDILQSKNPTYVALVSTPAGEIVYVTSDIKLSDSFILYGDPVKIYQVGRDKDGNAIARSIK